ncbi:MAG: AAA family ATPase [Thermoguttaceae bacterium]
MANDDIPRKNEQPDSPSMALLPTGESNRQNGEWSVTSTLTQPAGPTVAFVDPMLYVHAFRRHWLMAVGIGMLCAAIAGPAVYFGVGPRYTASSYLRVDLQEKNIAFHPDAVATDRDRFEIYKNTQQQLLLNRFVLLAAIRKPEAHQLPIIMEETEYGDPVQWLASHLSVSFPGRAELMQVSLTRPDAEEATLLVRSVVDVFLTEVVNAEGLQKRQRLDDLDRAYTEKETRVREKRQDLKKVAEQLGTSDTETLTLKQKLALEELTIYQQEATRVRFERQRLTGDLAAQQAMLKSVNTLDVSDADVEILVQSDPIARQLFFELGMRKIDQIRAEGAVVAGLKSNYADRYQQDLKTMQDQFDARRNELSEMVRRKKRMTIQMEVERLQAAVAVMTEQEHAIQAEVAAKRKEAERFGNSTVDIEMMRADIKNLEGVLGEIAEEREKLRVESRSAPRITMIQRAEKPDVASNDMLRLVLTVAAMLAAVACPIVLVVLWDVRAKRINSCADVSKGLRLPVIGSVPLIPTRVIRRIGSPSKRCQTWHIRLTESVDGIAARVLRKADMEKNRVIMVSSATGGEGKTTLATQLALSLARAGRRTVLVDFDLRRPAFDEVFGLPLEPGVCEALREHNVESTMVHQIATNNMAVVTAGRWDRTALASLSNGSAAMMFRKLREEYDFVIVDTSPILPVADSRFVSQHVDSVVMSVFRDVSEAPKIQAACEILSAFGVHSIEAVVTGPNDHMYGEHMGYESSISA